MTRAIVGYTGLVGSNLLQFYKFDYFYNSKNFHDAQNMEFDEIFFCGIPAVKWYANKFPEEDTSVIESIKKILKTIKTKKIILISTIDVYEYTDSDINEDYDCDIFNNHTYGINRYLFEDFIKKQFENFHIIRLPALFGKGLKKNIIYDLINKNQIENISKDTFFQWYDLNWLKKISIHKSSKIFLAFSTVPSSASVQNRPGKAVQQTREDRSRLFWRSVQGHRQAGQLGSSHKNHRSRRGRR